MEKGKEGLTSGKNIDNHIIPIVYKRVRVCSFLKRETFSRASNKEKGSYFIGWVVMNVWTAIHVGRYGHKLKVPS